MSRDVTLVDGVMEQNLYLHPLGTSTFFFKKKKKKKKKNIGYSHGVNG
jgi:hypothetical protein